MLETLKNNHLNFDFSNNVAALRVKNYALKQSATAVCLLLRALVFTALKSLKSSNICQKSQNGYVLAADNFLQRFIKMLTESIQVIFSVFSINGLF